MLTGGLKGGRRLTPEEQRRMEQEADAAAARALKEDDVADDSRPDYASGNTGTGTGQTVATAPTPIDPQDMPEDIGEDDLPEDGE